MGAKETRSRNKRGRRERDEPPAKERSEGYGLECKSTWTDMGHIIGHEKVRQEKQTTERESGRGSLVCNSDLRLSTCASWDRVDYLKAKQPDRVAVKN